MDHAVVAAVLHSVDVVIGDIPALAQFPDDITLYCPEKYTSHKRWIIRVCNYFFTDVGDVDTLENILICLIDGEYLLKHC